jgi:hypothetical protein
MMSYLYMAVTPDEFELPIAVEDQMGKLARTLKMPRSYLDQLFSKQKKGLSMRNPPFYIRKVEVNWEEDDE